MIYCNNLIDVELLTSVNLPSGDFNVMKLISELTEFSVESKYFHSTP